MIIQRDLFSVSLTEKIKTVCDYKKLVYMSIALSRLLIVSVVLVFILFKVRKQNS